MYKKMANKVITGEISKISGIKTFRVTVEYSKVHKKYKKIVSYKRSYLAHSENEHAVGETVEIVPSTRRLSKMKNYVIVEQKAKVSKK